MATEALGSQRLAQAPRHAWAERISRGWAYAKRLYLFLLPLRFSFLALAVVGFAFLVSDQGHDIIAAMTEDDPVHIQSLHFWQRVFLVPLVSILALQVWYWSRTMLRLCFPDMPAASEFPRTTLLLPRALGVLAYGIMLGALYRVGREYQGHGQPLSTLWTLAWCLMAAAVVFIIFCIGRRRVLEKREGTDMSARSNYSVMRQKKPQELAASTKWVLIASVLVAVFFFLSSCFSVQRTGRLGSLGIVLLSLALWVSFGSLLVYFGTRLRMPILSLLLGLALLFSPLADNHVVMRLKDTADRVGKRPTLAEAFDRWSARLAGDSRYKLEGSHPVFVVATEGGGIRAAYWTAAVLTALDDRIPGFRDHLFAVSGVSGGSVGAATYAALITRKEDLRDSRMKLRPIAQGMLSYDALAPTLSAMAQQDFVQRFIPFPFLPDRARALEGGWETAWKRETGGDNRFSRGFLAMLSGREDRMPSFFLNGTAVETGERMIASNCKIRESFSNALDVFDAAGADLRLSTTALNSARFTYLSPAGTFRRTDYKDVSRPSYDPYHCSTGKRCEHVVDGGYLDNSGAITAAEIVSAIQSRSLDPKGPRVPIKPYVLVIRYMTVSEKPVPPELWANESLSPVRALLNTRGARAALAVGQLQQQAGIQVVDFNLVQQENTVPIPLGWLLSPYTRSVIDAQIGLDAKENGAAVSQLEDVLRTRIEADPAQKQAAATPAVKDILATPPAAEGSKK